MASQSLETGKDWYMYLTVGHEPFRNGGSGKVVVSITYWGGGGGQARLVYDSGVTLPQVPGGAPGVWKRAGMFELDGSPGWRTWTVELPDPRFSGRCNGADLRLEISGTVEPPVIASVVITKK